MRAAAFLSLLGCGGPVHLPATEPSEPVERVETTPAAEPIKEGPFIGPPQKVTLAAVGDILPHRNVKATAAAQGWDFVFSEVAPILRSADLAFGNLEGPIAPIAHRGIWGEVFNAPAELADGLAQAGFDIVSLANNHVYDQGPAGLTETLANLQRVGIDAVGAGADCAAAEAPVIHEVRGLRIAWLATVDLLNIDDRAGPDSPCVFVAGELCTADCGPDRDALHYLPDTERLVAAVQAVDADFIILSFHWGDEYRTEPLPEYPVLAEALIEAGVDLILGHHPHVLQPIESIRTASGREGWVAYSLGNFVSNMGAAYQPGTSPDRRGNTRDGGILTVELIRDSAGDRLGEVGFIPTWTVNDSAAGIRPPTVRPVPHARLEQDEAARDLTVLRRAVIAEVIGERWVDLGPFDAP